MAGSKEAAIKTAATLKAKYGENYYARIGAEGGRAGNTGGFAYMKANGQTEKIREAARKAASIRWNKNET